MQTHTLDRNDHRKKLHRGLDIRDTTTTTRPTPVCVSIPAFPPTPTPKAKTKHKGVVRRVFSSFGGHSSSKKRHQQRDRVLVKQKKEKKHKKSKKNKKTSEKTAGIESARPGDCDWLVSHPTTHCPDRPGGSSSGSGSDGRSAANQKQQQYLTEAECERRDIMQQIREQQQRTGVAPVAATTTGAVRINNTNNSKGHTKPDTHIQMKSKPHHPHPHLHPHPHPRNATGGDPPLVLRTRNISNAGSVNYCYPLCSPRSNRLENPFASVGLRPPMIQGGSGGERTQRRESNDSSSTSSNNNNNNGGGGGSQQGETMYAPDSSEAVSSNMMTINVYPSASLARRFNNGNSSSNIGRGISVRKKLDRDKPTPSTPQDVHTHSSNHHHGEAPRDEFRGNSNGGEDMQTRMRRKMSVKETPNKHNRTLARKSQIIHRRRQTRYGRPSIRGAGRASPTSTYYDSLDIHGPLSTPSLYGKLASQGSNATRREPLTPPDTNSNAFFNSADLHQRCPVPGCTSNKPVMSSSGLCEDCAMEFRPRESTFAPLRKQPAPAVDPIEFNKMFGPIDYLGSTDLDTPAEKVASKFNPKFSPKLSANFKLQPPPGRKATVKHDSAKSFGSDRSHVGFQLAIPKTPEPKQQRQQQQRYSDGQADEDADPGSATSEGTWESCYSNASPTSPSWSVRSWDPAESPSLRRSRESAESRGGYSDIVDIYKESEHNNHTDIDDNDDIYTEINNIIDEYLKDNELDETGNELRKESVIASFTEKVAEIENATKAVEEVKRVESAPPHRGIPTRSRAVKKSRDTRGSRGADASIRSSGDLKRANGPQKHPQWEWI